MEQKAQLKNLRAELRALRLQRAATLFEARAKKANLKAIKDSLVTKGIQSGTQTRKSGKKVVTPFKAKLGGLPGLWLVSIIATLAYKIPILNTITKRFFLWYGKSTWLEATNITTDRPSKKLDEKRWGPFKVISKISALSYKLDLPHNWKQVHNVFNL